MMPPGRGPALPATLPGSPLEIDYPVKGSSLTFVFSSWPPLL
jgi:hypothetical protein